MCKMTSYPWVCVTSPKMCALLCRKSETPGYRQLGRSYCGDLQRAALPPLWFSFFSNPKRSLKEEEKTFYAILHQKRCKKKILRKKMHLKWMKNGDSLRRWWFLAWDLSHGHSGNKNHWIFTTVGPSHKELVILEIEELRSLETVRSFWLVKAKRCHPLWAGCRGYVQPIRWAEKMQLLPEMLQEAEEEVPWPPLPSLEPLISHQCFFLKGWVQGEIGWLRSLFNPLASKAEQRSMENSLKQRDPEWAHMKRQMLPSKKDDHCLQNHHRSMHSEEMNIHQIQHQRWKN